MLSNTLLKWAAAGVLSLATVPAFAASHKHLGATTRPSQGLSATTGKAHHLAATKHARSLLTGHGKHAIKHYKHHNKTAAAHKHSAKALDKAAAAQSNM